MTQRVLHLAKDLSLPLEAVTQTIALRCGGGTRMPTVVAAVAPIVRLFLRRGPAAVLWCVWAIVVAPVDRVLVGWPFAQHLSET